MQQLRLFDSLAPASPPTRGHRPLAATSEQLLQVFAAARIAEGAHPRSVACERSQLRALARHGGGGRSDPLPLADLFADLALVARALREPSHPVARSTGLARLRAAQRFIRHIGPLLGRDPAADLRSLDTLLPARRRTGWHTAGTVVAGTAGRRRRRGPTLTTLDLHRVIAAADARSPQAARDRALVALHCFSGLRAEEILRLRWDDLSLAVTEAGHRRLTATLVRDGRCLRLPILGPATEAIGELTQRMADIGRPLSGPIITTRADSGRALGYRAARNVLRAACQRAGFPPAEAADLRAAFAHWLRTHGLSDHEVAAVLGLAKVRSVDRLLRRHRALDAQRSARERMDR